MKLRNILCAGLAVLLLTNGCSKDDEKGGSQSTDEARLNVKVNTSHSGIKADDDPERLPGENLINNVGAIVFSQDGSELLGKLWQTMESETEATILNIPAKNEKVQIILFANCPQNLFDGVTSYADLQSKLAQLSEQKQSYLTMSSQVIKTTEALKAGDENYLGYSAIGDDNINGIKTPVELTRLAARLDLNAVSTTFSGTKLEGRTVRIDGISIGNQKLASRFFSEDYWGVVMVDANLETSTSTTINRSVLDGSPLSGNIYRHYVMENMDANHPTQILVRATLLAIPGYGAETKIFAATVNLNGVVLVGQQHKHVKRNYVYRLRVNFSGNSFSGEEEPPVPPEPPVEDDSAALDVQVEVVGWGPVDQDVVIE